MNSFLDHAEEAALKLRDLGEQTVDALKPAFHKGWNQASESARDFCETIRPDVEKGIDRAVDACARLKQTLQGDKDSPAPSASLDEELEQSVRERLEKIRAAQNGPSPFSDLFSEKHDQS